jgi:hypothetical protein
MSAPDDPRNDPAAPDAPPAIDTATIGKIVREELDRQKQYLDFAQTQIEKDRGFYKYLYTIAGAFLAFMVAVAGFFSYSNVSQMRSDMKASVDAELVALRAQSVATSQEAHSTVTRELDNVRTEVEKRIQTEFRSDNIQKLISNAARDRTNNELTEIIRDETAKQVAEAILEQSPAIRKNVEDQTRVAVKELQPIIDGIVHAELEHQVKKSVAPVESEMQKMAAAFAQATLTQLAMSGQMFSGFQTSYKFQIHDQIIASLKELHLPNSDISEVQQPWISVYCSLLLDVIETAVKSLPNGKAADEIDSLPQDAERGLPSPETLQKWIAAKSFNAGAVTKLVDEYAQLWTTGTMTDPSLIPFNQNLRSHEKK